MSLFEKAGAKFAEATAAFTDGQRAAYACRNCESAVDEDYDHCPHCGEAAVEPVS